MGLAVVLGVFIHHWGVNKHTIDPEQTAAMSHSLNLPFLKTWVHEGGQWVPAPNLITLPAGLFVLVAVLVIAGSSNAVNLTDGMDGLASGIGSQSRAGMTVPPVTRRLPLSTR